MASNGIEDQYSEADFELAMVRLGWLSSYSRQALLSRHLLRCLEDEDVVHDILSRAPKRFALDCFRVVISALSGATTETKVFSAPYEPANRPTTHFLAFNRKERIFEVSIGSGMPSFRLNYKKLSSYALENGTGVDDAEILLIDEVALLAEGVTLSTKRKADDRIAELRDKPLWAAFRNDHRRATTTFFRNWYPSQPDVGEFWERWLDGIKLGEPLDWNLQRKVALIPNSTWDDGPEAVSKAIAEIEAELLAEKLARAEKIERDPIDGRYTVTSTVITPDDMIERSLKNLSFSLSIAMKGHNRSGFDDLCVAYQYLDHTRQNCLVDPNGVHDNYRIAREIIEGKLAKEEYLPEDGLVALVQFLERQEVQLRADHPAIRKAHDRLVQQRLRELDDEKRIQLAADFEELTEETKGRLSAEFGLDSKALASNSGPEAQADALKRAGGRSQLMTLAEKGSETAKAIDASGGWKATKIGVLLVRIGVGMSGLF